MTYREMSTEPRVNSRPSHKNDDYFTLGLPIESQ